MPRSHRHVPFVDLFAHGGLALALSAGFGIAVLLAAHLGLGLDLGAWWPLLIQVHGHAQVFGWLGLFIMGVSLAFLPRLAGVPLRSAAAARAVAVLATGGIVLRAGGQVALYAGLPAGGFGLAVAAAAQLVGVGLYLALLLDCMWAAPPQRQALRSLWPCFASTLAGWLLAAGVGAWQTAGAAGRRGLLDPGWERLGVDLFVGLVLLPMAFAFSVRTFPLYLRLPAVRWPVGRVVGVYLLGFGLELVPRLAALRLAEPAGLGPLPLAGALGHLLKGAALLGFVWGLDLLTRRRPAWIAGREGAPPSRRRLHSQPRPRLPDYGEFGHFEWLVYGAYACLTAGGALELHGGLGRLTGSWTPVAADVMRHLYLAGFGTLLLLGMAPRMLPGFWGLRRPASTRLVDLSFFLGAAAVLLRLLPVATTAGWALWPLRRAFALSGLLGWLAVASLAANLWATWWRRPGAPTRIDRGVP